MDTGLNVRPVLAAQSAPARVDPPVTRQAVVPELPDTQAVTAASEDVPVRFNEESGARNMRAALNSALDQKTSKLASTPVSQVVRDEATKELIFRKVNPETGRIVGQYPDEAIMRLKAYNAQLRKEELDAPKNVVA
jgi:hypothetical protein